MMGPNRKKLSGVFAPVVTPFHSDELALDDLRFNLRELNKTGLAGYLALGSNGEFRSLTDAEQIQVLEVFAEEELVNEEIKYSGRDAIYEEALTMVARMTAA